jgi:hypothetical protein
MAHLRFRPLFVVRSRPTPQSRLKKTAPERGAVPPARQAQFIGRGVWAR